MGFRFPRAILFILAAISFCTACTPKASPPEAQQEVASVGLHAGKLSADGRWAIAGSIHHGVSLWRVDDKERLYNWSHKQNIDTTLVGGGFSTQNNLAVTADISTLVLWDLTDGKALRFWHAPGEILSIALTPNGQFALLGLADHSAVLFNIQAGGIVRTLHHKNRVRSVDISADGKHALTGSEDYQAIYWNLETGEALQKMLHNDDVQLVKLSEDGALALSVSKYDRATLWRTQDGSQVGDVPLRAQHIKRGMRFTAARFSADNRYLLTGRPDQIITLWSVEPLKEIARWKIPKRKAWKPQGASIIDVAFKEKSNQLVALSSNGFLSFMSFNASAMDKQ